jgi:ribosomal-protein-alanine N-acetyltransferase
MIETQRLRIRPWREADARHYVTLSEDVGYTCFSTPGYYSVASLAEALGKLAPRIALHEARGLGKLPVFERDGDEIVGTCGLDPFELEGRPVVELGYRLRLSHWGKGYATEAAAAMLRHAFETLRLPEVYAFALPHNAASIKVLQRLGLREVGICRHSGLEHRLFVARPGEVATEAGAVRAPAPPIAPSAPETLAAIETERLVLRGLGPEDAERVADFQWRNREFMAAHEPPRPADYYTPAHWRRRLEELATHARADRHYSYFVLTKAEPQAIVGWVNFSNVVRGAFHACHLGYNLCAAAEGRGYMVEALRAAIPHMFEAKGLHRIMANYVPTNARSERVLTALGFQREGLAKDYLLLGGAWRDHVLTSLVNPAWRAPAP